MAKVAKRILKWTGLLIGVVALGRYDLLILPVTPGPAIAHNPNHDAIPLNGRRINYWDYFYYPMCFNATGHPALTIPMGLDRDGLPVASLPA